MSYHSDGGFRQHEVETEGGRGFTRREEYEWSDKDNEWILREVG